MGKKKAVKKKGKKKVKNKKPSKAFEKYKVDSGKIIRAKSCPKCGTGYFLAEHKTRLYCGKCHYVEFKSKPSGFLKASEPLHHAPKVEEKKVEVSK